MPDRKADNRHWTVRVVANRLRRIRDSANVSASGKFIGLDDAALDFCERVRTAACSDRWCKTILYGIATDLVNAHLNADRGRRTRSATACARYRCRAVKAIDDFGQRLHAAGIARS